MSTAYVDEILNNKKFTGNIVIQVGDTYFGIRSPDSGLVIDSPYDKSVVSLTLNPTSVDVLKVTTTISSFTFRLSDKGNIITSLVLGDAQNLIGLPVTIWLGRSGTGMAFSDYFALPLTYVQKLDHADNTYSFSCSTSAQRMDRPIYAFTSATAVDLLVGTTIWTMRDDLTNFPTSGFLKIEDEFVSYSGVDLVNNQFTGVIRGELNSVPAAHAQFTDSVLVETVTDNPLNILLKILVSGGGGSAYDVLQDGLGIDNTLVDIADIESLRDDVFLGDQFTLSLYSIDSALKYIEDEILMPNGLRLTVSRNSKISVAVLNSARFVEETDIIDEDTITKYPKWSLDGVTVTNEIQIQWDFNEATQVFEKYSVFTNTDSITLYGASSPLALAFKGIKSALSGAALINAFGAKLLDRLSLPTPVIQVNTQLDKSIQNVGDKAYLVSSKIPAADGTLNFASDLEIISRSINQTSGDVQFKLAFTSFTNMRSAYIAPSDLITTFISQSRVNVTLGRGSYYLVGWYMRLWDELNQVYCADPPNKIIAITDAGKYLLTQGGDKIVTQAGEGIELEQDATEDTITFLTDWATTLVAGGRYRIRFADYDDAVDSQKRYGFISAGGANFPDGKPTYKVTYS